MISERLFEIAALDPKSAIGIAVKILAEQQAQDEARREDQRKRTQKCCQKFSKERYRNITA